MKLGRGNVGGSPFETQGAGGDLFGRDIVYLRSYPIEAIGPRQGETAVGGRILNKYSAELRWQVLQTPQFTAAPYLFFDAANSFRGCIPGLHEVLRRQGLLEGLWCLDPEERLSPGQKREIDRVYQAYPKLHDDAFVAQHRDEWLNG